MHKDTLLSQSEAVTGLVFKVLGVANLLPDGKEIHHGVKIENPSLCYTQSGKRIDPLRAAEHCVCST